MCTYIFKTLFTGSSVWCPVMTWIGGMGWGWEGGPRGRGDICIDIADSLHFTAETNCKAIILQQNKIRASQVALVVKSPPICQCRRRKRHGFDPWVGKIPWRKAWQPTLGFLPREPQGQKSLVSYSPRGRKESNMTEVT